MDSAPLLGSLPQAFFHFHFLLISILEYKSHFTAFDNVYRMIRMGMQFQRVPGFNSGKKQLFFISDRLSIKN